MENDNHQSDSNHSDSEQNSEESHSDSETNSESDQSNGDSPTIYWGVDSASYTDEDLLQCVQDNFGQADVWGRYLGDIERSEERRVGKEGRCRGGGEQGEGK